MEGLSELFSDPMFRKWLLATGSGMMGQKNLGQALANGMQAGSMSLINDMDAKEAAKTKAADREAALSLWKQQQDYSKAQEDASKTQAFQGLLSSIQGAPVFQGTGPMQSFEGKQDIPAMLPGFQIDAVKNAAQSDPEIASKLATDFISQQFDTRKQILANQAEMAKESRTNSEWDRRFGMEHPGGVETPQQKRDAEFYNNQQIKEMDFKQQEKMKQMDVGKKAAEQRQQNLQSTLESDSLIEEASNLLNGKQKNKDGTYTQLPTPTHSGIGSMIDKAAAQFGVGTDGAETAGRLKVLGAALTMKVPRMEGPQSDKDAALYREAAASVGDETKPISTRQSALQTISRLNEKYREMNSGLVSPTQNSVRPGYIPFGG